MDVDGILKFIDKHIYETSGFWAGVVLIIIVALLLIHPMQIIPPSAFFGVPFISIILIFVLIWFIIWYKKRNHLPKNKHDKLNIIIAITTENEKQETRIKNDFREQLEDIIKSYKFPELIEITVLNNHQSKMVINNLDKNAITGNVPSKKARKIQKRLKGCFFICGSIRERKQKQNHFCLNLSAFVCHNSMNKLAQMELASDFNSIWKKKISFPEDLEQIGFDIIASHIGTALKFIMGQALLRTGYPGISLSLFDDLQKDKKIIMISQSAYGLIKEKLPRFIALCHLSYAFDAYYKKNDRKNAEKYLNMSLNANKSCYAALLFKGIVWFNKGDIKIAIKAIKEASEAPYKDSAWRYSLAFLYIASKKFEKALDVYKKIFATTYLDEEDSLKQVYLFNEGRIKNNPKHNFWSYFILGYLNYKKSTNLPAAYNYLSKYCELAKKKSAQKILVKEAEKCLLKIKKEMKIT